MKLSLIVPCYNEELNVRPVYIIKDIYESRAKEDAE